MMDLRVIRRGRRSRGKHAVPRDCWWMTRRIRWQDYRMVGDVNRSLPYIHTQASRTTFARMSEGTGQFFRFLLSCHWRPKTSYCGRWANAAVAPQRSTCGHPHKESREFFNIAAIGIRFGAICYAVQMREDR